MGIYPFRLQPMVLNKNYFNPGGMIMFYYISYTNAGDGRQHTIRRDSAHEAFLDVIEITDNASNSNIICWIEQ